jgi:hypothetical protein
MKEVLEPYPEFDVPNPRGVVKIELYEEDPGYVYAMERVEGASLEEILGRGVEKTYAQPVLEMMSILHKESDASMMHQLDFNEYIDSKFKEDKPDWIESLYSNSSALLETTKNVPHCIVLDSHPGNLIILPDKIVSIDHERDVVRPITDDISLFLTLAGLYNSEDSSGFDVEQAKDIYSKRFELTEDFDLDYLNSRVRLVFSLVPYYQGKQPSKMERIASQGIESISEIGSRFPEYYLGKKNSYEGLLNILSGFLSR